MLQDVPLGQAKRIHRYNIMGGGGTPVFSHQFCANLVSGPRGQPLPVASPLVRRPVGCTVVCILGSLYWTHVMRQPMWSKLCQSQHSILLDLSESESFHHPWSLVTFCVPCWSQFEAYRTASSGTRRVEKPLVYSTVTNANSTILNLSFKIARNGSRLIYATKAIWISFGISRKWIGTPFWSIKR